jgi:hypothetical protein
VLNFMNRAHSELAINSRFNPSDLDSLVLCRCSPNLFSILSDTVEAIRIRQNSPDRCQEPPNYFQYPETHFKASPDPSTDFSDTLSGFS